MSKKYYIAKKLKNGEYKIVGTISCHLLPIEKFRVTANVEDLRMVMNGYKVKKGFALEDKKWNADNYDIWMKTAKKLLKILGKPEICVQCIDDLGSKFDEKQLTWHLGTIVKNASSWELEANNG